MERDQWLEIVHFYVIHLNKTGTGKIAVNFVRKIKSFKTQ